LVLVYGSHFFDTFAKGARFECRYDFRSGHAPAHGTSTLEAPDVCVMPRLDALRMARAGRSPRGGIATRRNLARFSTTSSECERERRPVR